MASATITELSQNMKYRKHTETGGNPRSLASMRFRLQKRNTFPVIRHSGTSRELTMLAPERKLSRSSRSQETVTEPSKLSNGFCIDTDVWNLEDDEPDTSKSAYVSPQNVYLSACKRASVVATRQVWRQLMTSSVHLEHHQIGPLGTKALAVALVSNITVTSIELREAAVHPEGLQYLLEAVEENSNISVLKLPGNQLRSAGARLLGEFLKTNRSLTVLDVSENEFEDLDARFFADAIKANRSLQELGLGKNKLGQHGGILLERALAANTTLTKLDLSWNHLRHRGSVAVARSLQSNTALKTLNLSWNGLGLEGCYQMAKSLKRNRTLTELNLSSNRINFEAISFLLTGLAHNTSLEILKIGQNPITSDGALNILQILLTRPSCGIRELDLSDVSVHEDFLSTLREIQVKRPFKVTHGRVVCGSQLHKSRGPEVMNTDDPLLLLFEYTKGHNLRLIDLFKSLDKDKSETITREEFRDGLKSVGLVLSNQSLDILMNRLDINKDGNVDFEELMVGQKGYVRKAAKLRQRMDGGMNMALSEMLKDKLRMRTDYPSRPQSKTGIRSSGFQQKPT